MTPIPEDGIIQSAENLYKFSGIYASVLEQADRHVWGACVYDVWVQVPSLAPPDWVWTQFAFWTQFFILLFACVYGDIYFVIASQWRASIRGPCMKLSFLLFYFHMGHRYLFDSVECIGIKAKIWNSKMRQSRFWPFYMSPSDTLETVEYENWL